METVIQVENVSKQYRLGQIGTGSLSHDINRMWHRVRGKEDPYLKVGEANDREQKGNSEYVWALQNINFEVKRGEILGIIGRNGAGKSTLLKILSRTTMPSTGSIKIKGRIASLLEVGTGFHPELSGRDNIFLNGAILGMTKNEIKRKFDEIVDFSGVERYIDTPVKRYSSGMYVRLAFAVAAYLEPEILIIDEVLAVGDADFQKKCLGKMKDVSEGGRTVLFVSHNMAAVKTLCQKGLILNNGTVAFGGNITEAIQYYLFQKDIINNLRIFDDVKMYNTDKFRLSKIGLEKKDTQSQDAGILFDNDEIILNTELEIKDDVNNFHICYVVSNDMGILFTMPSSFKVRLTKGMNKLQCIFPKGFLNVGGYYLSLYIIENIQTGIFYEDNIFTFSIQQGARNVGDWMGIEPGFIKPDLQWVKVD